jgi:hypothetical protein
MIFTPIASSPLHSIASSDLIALRSATPPPATIPSFAAALVACRASSTRSFFSLRAVSVPAPTLITATPPDNLAKRSSKYFFA